LSVRADTTAVSARASALRCIHLDHRISAKDFSDAPLDLRKIRSWTYLSTTVGRDAIREVLAATLTHNSDFVIEEATPTVHYDDLALTSTRPADNTGGRVQVARRQPDGSWMRIIDRPEIRPA
jgi:hypothetical protein